MYFSYYSLLGQHYSMLSSVLSSSDTKRDRTQPLALRNSPARGGDSKDNSVGSDMVEGRKPRCRSREARYLVDLKHQRFLEESKGGEFQDVLNCLAKKKKKSGKGVDEKALGL